MPYQSLARLGRLVVLSLDAGINAPKVAAQYTADRLHGVAVPKHDANKLRQLFWLKTAAVSATQDGSVRGPARPSVGRIRPWDIVDGREFFLMLRRWIERNVVRADAHVLRAD